MLLTARYYIGFILSILFLFKAGPSGAQPLLLSRNVSVTVTGMPLNSVLQKLSKETGIRFSYDPELISSLKKVTLKAVNQPLGEVLNMLFSNSGFAFQEIGNQLVIYRKNKEPETRAPEFNRSEQKNIPPTIEKQIAAPDTVIITHTDTILKVRTDTLVKTETIIQHDTVSHTDTVYIERYKTQRAGKNPLPNFDKNSLHSQKFHEHNGLYAGIAYQQLIGKPSYNTTTNAYTDLARAMKDASSRSAMNFSVGALVGYDYLRIGIQSGVTYTRLGENFEYSYTRQTGGYYRTDTVDSYYTVSGIDTTRYYVTDSSYVNIDYKKFSYKHPNAYRYIEIPLLVKFRVFQGDKLEFYITGGILANLMIGNKALYIKPDNEKSVDWIAASVLKPVLFSWQAGLGLSYNFSNGIGLLLEASFRKQLSSQYKDYPLEKKFELVNIKTGIFVRL